MACCKYLFVPVEFTLSFETYHIYCKFRNFRDIFIFANGIKTHICHFKNHDKGYDGSPTSVNDRVIPPFCEGFIFPKLRKNF